MDLSPVMIASYCLLERDPLSFSLVGTRNAYHPGDQAIHVDLSPPAPSDRSGMTCVLGDATTMPVPDHSCDAVVSVYTTDAIPLSSLLPELRRVLKPTGRFIHVGPLGYHFPDVANHLACSELPGAFAQAGLRLHELSHLRAPHCANARNLYTAVFDNLCFWAEPAAGRRGED
jgi:SAM-dependent methyltransferase